MKTIDKLNKGQRVAYFDEKTGRRKCGQYLGTICGDVLIRRLDRNTEREWWTHELLDRKQLVQRTDFKLAKMIGYLQGRLNSKYTDSSAELEQMVLNEMLARNCAHEVFGDIEWRTDLCNVVDNGFRVAFTARIHAMKEGGR